MITNVSELRKAIAGAVTAGAGAILTAVTNGDLTYRDAIIAACMAAIAGASVYVTPNGERSAQGDSRDATTGEH